MGTVVGTPAALSERDLRTMVGIVSEADSAETAPGARLPWQVLHGIAGLVRCDDLTLHDLDSADRSSSFQQTRYDGAEELTADTMDVPEHPFWVHYWDGPCSYPDRTGDLRSVVTTSDFYSQRQWRATALYQDYFRPLRHGLLLTMPEGPGRTLRLVAFRDSDRPFSDRDRAVFMLLRPHLYAAYLQQQRRRQGMPVLTDRQWQLLQLVALGHTNAQIARRLGLAEGTVRKHMENIHARLGVTSRTAALARAFPERFAVA